MAYSFFLHLLCVRTFRAIQTDIQTEGGRERERDVFGDEISSLLIQGLRSLPPPRPFKNEEM